MLSSKRHIRGTLAGLVILFSSRASAQTVANSLEELRHVLKQGQTVAVTDTTGQETRGTVGALSQASLVVLVTGAPPLVEGERSFTEGTLTEVRRLEPPKKGALIGLGVGLGAGLAIISAMCADGPDCGPSVQVGVVAAGLGAAIGAGIHKLANKKGTVVFRSPTKLGLTLSPVLGRGRQGVLATISP